MIEVGVGGGDNTDGGGDTLCEEGLAREFGLVPAIAGWLVSGSFGSH